MLILHPFLKDGDKAEKTNYRPISILPVISRVLEMIVFDIDLPTQNY